MNFEYIISEMCTSTVWVYFLDSNNNKTPVVCISAPSSFVMVATVSVIKKGLPHFELQ